MSAWVWILGAGATAFFGRAALVALRRSGGGAGALGRGYYKGGFEPKMTRREAALILEMPYVYPNNTCLRTTTNI
jgi:DnaJ family protein C protein 19